MDWKRIFVKRDRELHQLKVDAYQEQALADETQQEALEMKQFAELVRRYIQWFNVVKESSKNLQKRMRKEIKTKDDHYIYIVGGAMSKWLQDSQERIMPEVYNFDGTQAFCDALFQKFSKEITDALRAIKMDDGMVDLVQDFMKYELFQSWLEVEFQMLYIRVALGVVYDRHRHVYHKYYKALDLEERRIINEHRVFFH
ncbi:hypothetical protein ACFL0V_07060 [Nanoarchaeota archaeon]